MVVILNLEKKDFISSKINYEIIHASDSPPVVGLL